MYIWPFVTTRHLEVSDGLEHIGKRRSWGHEENGRIENFQYNGGLAFFF